MVEVVVILAIITALSAVVLTSFTGLNEGTALNRGARELALAIRKAQNMSLAVTQIQVGSPPTFQVPPAVGLRATTAPPGYFIFADLIPLDSRYTSSAEKVPGTDAVFVRNVKVNAITYSVGGTSNPLPAVHIIFLPPEATIFFTRDNGTSIVTDKVDLELITPRGQKKTISVRSSGQISIK